MESVFCAPCSPILVSLLLKKSCLLAIFSLECAVLSTVCRVVLVGFLLDELNIQSHDKERPTQASHVAMETGGLEPGVCNVCSPDPHSQPTNLFTYFPTQY